MDIASRKKVIACEHCGRILVDNELAEETTDAIRSRFQKLNLEFRN